MTIQENTPMAGKKIDRTLNVNIPGGPNISASNRMDIEAYDMIEVEIPGEATDKKVQIIPGDNSEIRFLLIKTDTWSDSAGTTLKYKVNDGTDTSPAIDLDAPVHLFVGPGNVRVLGYSPNNLLFTNQLKDEKNEFIPVSVQVLVGRDATP
jgi:hypothetical protein